MIFPTDQAGYLQRGDRTTIRIPVDRRLTASPLRPVRKNEAKPFLPAQGQLIDIAQPTTSRNGRENVCHVRITAITRGPLGHLTEDQAIREGYPSPDAFIWAWTRRYDREWATRNLTYLTDQGTDHADALETVQLMALNRYPDRWANREVWTLTVQPEHDLDRHMERAATAKSEHGYTIGADQIDAGTVPPVDLLAATWTRRSARRHLEALADNATPQERSRRARALARRVRELALQDPRLTRQIEDLVRQAEQEAA